MDIFGTTHYSCINVHFNQFLCSLSKLFQGLLSEVEVKYKMSQCYLHLKEYRDATTIVCEVVSLSYIYNFSIN